MLAIKEVLINCEKRINQYHPINPLSFDKLPSNHNLRQLEKVAGTAVKCSPSFNQRFLKIMLETYSNEHATRKPTASLGILDLL